MNTPWLDDKYVMLLSGSLDKFKVINRSPLQANFRCPICGDSKKNKNKARGYLFRTGDGSTVFKCHNCGESRLFKNLIKSINYPMYQEYMAERFRESPRNKHRTFEVAQIKREKTAVVLPVSKNPADLVRMSDLPLDHEAVTYWESRKIPVARMKDAWWCDAFYSWVNARVIPDKFTLSATSRDCGRIVFPFRDEDGNITGYTGRSLQDEPKYVAIKVIEERMSAFGMDRVDTSRDVIVTEGPIDSLFLDNAVAMGTASKGSLGVPKRIYAIDNEPRNPQIVKIIKRLIDSGERVVIWPSGLNEKDINDMVLSGKSPQDIIESNTFKGLRALLEFDRWKKC